MMMRLPQVRFGIVEREHRRVLLERGLGAPCTSTGTSGSYAYAGLGTANLLAS
jgi:hypothetical protein